MIEPAQVDKQRFPGDQLQLDLVSVVARLRQLRDEAWFDSSHWLWGRLVTCDLPRLEQHLDEQVKAWLNRIDAEFRAPS